MVDGLADAFAAVVAITVTPFHHDGGLDEEAFARVVTRMVDGGVTTVTANGNTGEFYALTPAECDRALDLTVKAAGDRATVMAGVGFDAVTAAEMTRRAARAGARAVMVHQPVHPYQSPQGWIAYHRAIADAAPDLGVVCYVRNPTVTGATLAALADACPNVVAVKYAVPDVFVFANTVSAGDAALGAGRLVWSCGLAESWAPFFWLAGARGFTSGLVTVAPTLSLALLDRLRAGDTDAAMHLWRRLKPLEDLRARRGGELNVSVVKEALAQLGVCAPDVRPPISPLVDSEREEVRRILRAWHLNPSA